MSENDNISENIEQTDEQTVNKKENDKISASFLLFIAIMLIVIASAVTFLVCTKIYNKRIDRIRSCKVVFDKNTTDPETVAKFQDILDFIESDFSLEYDLNRMVEGAIEGMVNSLGDPYTYYIKPGKYSDYNEYITGKYVGIGILYEKTDGGLDVVSVYGDTPAEEAGLEAGDVITHVGGISTADLSEDDINAAFSKNGEQITVTVRKSGGNLKDLVITVSELTRQTVYVTDEEGGICNIRITQFTETTADEFNRAIDHAETSGAKGLIIDLRSNGGGYASAACAVADRLLGEGIIAYSENKNGERKEEYKSDASCTDLPAVLLVNGQTASASELVTGAFRDFKRGSIIGTKTFGKALGQVSRSYSSDGSGIVITVTKFYTPSGECIHGVGITPDIIVEDEEAQLTSARGIILK